MHWSHSLIIAVSGLSLVSSQPNYTYTTRTSLVQYLLTGYDNKARPSATTYVDIGLLLSHINELDTINQVLDIAGGAGINWIDPRLQWDISLYNMSYVSIPLPDLWAPELTIYNSMDGRQLFNNDENVASENALVYPTGNVVWPHSIRFRSQCAVKIRYYPFDSQTCEITLLPWNYFVDDMVLTVTTADINTEIFAENGEWDLTETSAVPGQMHATGFTYSTVEYKLHLRRKQSYYLMNILLPVMFLAFLGPVVFVLPVESGEKASFALTILLSLSVVMTIVSDRIPSTSTQVSLLSVYLLITFIVCVIEVLLTAVTVRIQHANTMGLKPSPRFNSFLKHCFAPLVRYRRTNDKEQTYGSRKTKAEGQTDDETRHRTDSVKSTTDKEFSVKDFGEDNSTCTETAGYTYKDFCVMFDRLNFFVFQTFTAIITFGFFITISIGGSL